MMSRIDRIRRAALVRRAYRAEADGPDAATRAEPGLPVPAGRVEPPRSFRDGAAESGFAAQLIGQDGQRRGLRAGASLLDFARAAYNRVEWSGSFDRRARKGRQAKTEI
ncbi:hypothetical protein [Phenylobacterium sp.]|uniref:hypothetical protein n=1 Tax=Phenylobacterium sp. TaxID=1871053 RepID=UPI00301C3166